MFPVARAHCILTIKFACSFCFVLFCFVFLNNVCIHKSLKCRQICYRMIFDLNMLKTSVVFYLLNQIFESVSDFTLQKKYQQGGSRTTKSRLLSRLDTFAIIVILDLKIHQSIRIQ